MNRSKLANGLGYAGLLPFIAGTVALFSTDPAISGPALYSLTVYAAVILSFMGAVHWGLAMQSTETGANWQLGLSVLPALLAWLSVSLQTPSGALLSLAGGFAVLAIIEIFAATKGFVPGWYRNLRIPLTVIVVGLLLLAYSRLP
ncbi:MAG: DUF3429 domain-containing protein [Pseudomonadota bacterium]